MEAVGIAVVVFGPLVTTLWLLLKAIRKLMPQQSAAPTWGQFGDPPRPAETAGDREPRRPLTPSRSGAVSVALPVAHDDETPEVEVRHIASPSQSGGGDERLAG